MLRKVLSLILVCLLALTAFAACGETVAETDEVTQTNDGRFVWERDGSTHWKVYEDGTTSSPEEHTLDDLDVCTACKSQIWDFGNGVNVYDYDEQGNTVRTSEYDENGRLVYEDKYEYEYDADGNCIKDTCYVNGVLSSVTEYAINADGEMVTCAYTGYREDGSTSVCSYDDFGNITEILDYDADGNLWATTDYLYKADENGDLYTAKETTLFSDGTSSIYEYNEHCDYTVIGEYDADGNAVLEDSYEYTYDEEGRTMGVKEYSFGVLKREVVKGLFIEEDGWFTYDLYETVYNEDGTKTVYEYDENGNLVK